MSGQKELKSIKFIVESKVLLFRVTANDDSFIDYPYIELCDSSTVEYLSDVLNILPSDCLNLVNSEYVPKE